MTLALSRNHNFQVPEENFTWFPSGLKIKKTEAVAFNKQEHTSCIYLVSNSVLYAINTKTKRSYSSHTQNPHI